MVDAAYARTCIHTYTNIHAQYHDNQEICKPKIAQMMNKKGAKVYPSVDAVQVCMYVRLYVYIEFKIAQMMNKKGAKVYPSVDAVQVCIYVLTTFVCMYV